MSFLSRRSRGPHVYRYDPKDHRGGKLMLVWLGLNRPWRFGSWPLSFGKAFDLGVVRIIWDIDSVKHAESMQVLLAGHKMWQERQDA